MSQVIAEERKIEEDIENIIDENRVVNFSDAVFAFAATLLVLKIDIPQINSGFVEAQLTSSLVALWPQYLANIISFLIIGYYWLTHHIVFGLLRKLNRTVVWLNIVFLILVSFIPFPVDLYGDFHTVPMVVVFYSASLALVGYMLAVIWWYASTNNKLISPEMTKRKIAFITSKVLVAPVVFTLSIPLVYFHPLAAQASWIFIILGVLVINKKFPYRE
ncbi:MAG TPA: TMEM175 family protein [Candidatus Levybacteria bacterium]|nr:TMEM175 family protein [Candidatus Levybacteria bacterium]